MGHDGVCAMSRPPRFTLAAPPSDDAVAIITGTELHHMRDVARMREGAEVGLLGPGGVEYAGRIERFEGDRALIRIAAVAPARPRTAIVVAAAMIKGPRMDFIVEKAAELGASELWPVSCARGIVQTPGRERLERWRRLALAAAKQSLSAAPMEVRAPRGFDAMLRAVPKDALAVICAMGAEPVAGLIRRLRPRTILIACGPEGGFDERETAAALRAGFVQAGLGPKRLRSETAAIAALSVTAGALDELSEGD
jgi:16S rRNA (uracil1498-N3)-methyltransferase